jgi:L-alanine-DL-glutamate epimerase-like enolase superfamily enzyme
MKIIDAQTWILRIPFVRTSRDFDDAHHELVGVTVVAEDGTRGTGFAFVMDFGGGSAVKRLLDEVMIPRVVGRSLYDGKRIWSELSGITHRMGRGLTSFAIAAIDIAIWDARARHHGHSLAAELGQVYDAVPAYGSGKASPHLPVDELVQLAEQYVESGLTAVKLRVGLDPASDPTRVGAVRAALGDNVRLMCDANERLDLPSALALGHRLSEHDIFWFEEPVDADNVAAYARLSEALPMPIAGGEHLCSATEFVRYVDAKAIDILQPNATMVRGITEIMQIGDLAAAHGLGFAPHFVTELHVHVAAALPNATYLEYFPFLDEYIEEGLQLSGGTVLVPERPGHGIDFTEHTWETFRTA